MCKNCSFVDYSTLHLQPGQSYAGAQIATWAIQQLSRTSLVNCFDFVSGNASGETGLKKWTCVPHQAAEVAI